MGKKKKWIPSDMNKGALRAEAKREGFIKGEESLSMEDLEKLAKKGGKTAKRANLAKTFRSFKHGKKGK